MYNGIRIDNLSVFNVNMTGLYIKLDKKLFLKAETIKINSNVTKSSSSSSLDEALDVIPYIHTFFSTIIINNIEYDNEKVQLTYKDENFYLNSSLLTLQTKIELTSRRKLILDVEEAHLKDIDITLKGILNADLRRKEYAFDGTYRLFDITGSAKLEIKNMILSYHINSNDFSSPKIVINNLLKYVKLDDTALNWIYGYTKAENYKLLYFAGKIDLAKRDFYPKSINALVKADNVNVTFNPQVPNANVEEVRVKIENNQILFLLTNPTYQDVNLTKADITIYNLADESRGIKIDLASNTHYNNAVNQIIKAYTGADIPIRQKSGKTQANVSIDVKFADSQVNVTADISLENADLQTSGVLMHAPDANIFLNNSIIKFQDARVQYGELFDISINGTLDANAKEMTAVSFIHSLSAEAKNRSIVSISNISTPFTLNILDNGINLYFDELQSNLTFSDTNVFSFNALEKLYPYSDIAKEYGIKTGRIILRSKDFKRLAGYANIRGLNLPLSYNGAPMRRFAGTFEITEDSFEAKTNNQRFGVSFKDEVNLTINSLDINIDTNGSGVFLASTPISITAQNSSLIFNPSNSVLLADSYNISLKDNNLSLHLLYNNTPLDFVKDENSFYIVTKNMKSEFLNPLANKEFFRKGSFDFYAKGENEDEFFGVLSLNETRLRDFKILNNLIAFFNTIPSLATLSDPMYSTSGFPVKNGTVEFIKSGDYLYVQTLFLEGYSSDIKGSGYIDLKTNGVYLDLRVFIIKSLSGIIDKIPLVNYIILGDEGTIEVRLSVRGTLDEPKIETNIINDALMSPFNMIKRVFELPSYLLQ
ncbi:MAG: AsmA-like C-terminal domain-containing protein [Campylobacteraceae bacterium]|nr:AsmA-like C-terminal domain-containing protein [Campylobacteraceae bacterium]